MREAGRRPWCAIEGSIRHTTTSTVILVRADESVQEPRPGAISMERITAALERIAAALERITAALETAPG